MVYGRYNELDNYGIHGVYEPTNITGGAILYSPIYIHTINHSYWSYKPT